MTSMQKSEWVQEGEREEEDKSSLTASTTVHEEHRRKEGCAEALEKKNENMKRNACARRMKT